jgi:hypothetical protein
MLPVSQHLDQCSEVWKFLKGLQNTHCFNTYTIHYHKHLQDIKHIQCFEIDEYEIHFTSEAGFLILSQMHSENTIYKNPAS